MRKRTGLILALIVLGYITLPKDKSGLNVESSSEIKVQTENKEISKIAKPKREENSESTKSTKRKSEACLPKGLDFKKVSLEELKSLVFDNSKPINEEEHLRSYHLESPNGEIYVVRIDSDQNRNQQEIKRLKFFIEDETGLPWPQKLKEEIAVNPSLDTINSFLDKGEVFFSDRVFSLEQDQTSITFHTSSEGMNEFHIQKPNSFLECKSGDSSWHCRCI